MDFNAWTEGHHEQEGQQHQALSPPFACFEQMMQDMMQGLNQITQQLAQQVAASTAQLAFSVENTMAAARQAQARVSIPAPSSPLSSSSIISQDYSANDVPYYKDKASSLPL